MNKCLLFIKLHYCKKRERSHYVLQEQKLLLTCLWLGKKWYFHQDIKEKVIIYFILSSIIFLNCYLAKSLLSRQSTMEISSVDSKSIRCVWKVIQAPRALGPVWFWPITRHPPHFNQTQVWRLSKPTALHLLAGAQETTSKNETPEEFTSYRLASLKHWALCQQPT